MADGDRASRRTAFASALALLSGFLLVTQSEFRANWQQFGSPTVMQEAVANRAAGRGTADLIRTAAIDRLARVGGKTLVS